MLDHQFVFEIIENSLYERAFAQNNSLNRRLADVLNSIDQKKLDAMNAANALKEKELIQKKAEADAVAKRENL